MKIKWIWGAIGLSSLLIVLAGISPALGESNKLFGTERPVMEAMETPSFGAEDYVPPQGVPPVVTVRTPSFGTEDFLVAETPSSEAVDWAEAMELSDAVGTGAIPAPASMKPNLDDYYPD